MSNAASPPWAARVLVADDDPQMRALLTDVLVEAGCSVVDACDGFAAIEQLAVEAKPWEYDLVITDHRMPGYTGVDLIRWLRTQQGPPMILISAFASEALTKQAQQVRGVAVLAKPFPIDRLLGMVRGMIGPL